MSALGLQRTLGLGSYETAWTCLHKLRRAMIRPNRELLAGKIEVDEILVGGRSNQHGGRTLGEKAFVVIAAEVGEYGVGRIRLKRIPNATKEHLRRFIKQAIIPGATVITDGWPAYASLPKHGYIHQPHSLNATGKKGATTLPNVHRVAALLKRWILGTYQGRISWPQLDHYLEEFTFRFNRRKSSSRGQLFYRLLQQAVAVEPTPYAALVTRKNHKR